MREKIIKEKCLEFGGVEIKKLKIFIKLGNKFIKSLISNLVKILTFD